MRKYLVISALLMTILASMAQSVYAASTTVNRCEGSNLSRATIERCAARKRVLEVRAANLARQAENRKLRESKNAIIQNIVSTRTGTTTTQAVRSLTGTDLTTYTDTTAIIKINQQNAINERSEARLNQLRIVVAQILERLPRTTAQQRVTINANINKQIDIIIVSNLYTTESKREMLRLLQSVIDYKIATLELKQSTIAAPVGSTINANSIQEIGRFALAAGDNNLTVSSLRIVNKGTATLRPIVKDVYIVDVITGNRVSTSGIFMSGAIIFSDLNQVINAYTTNNYKIMADIGSINKQSGKTIELFINPKSIVASTSSGSTPVNVQ